MKRTIQVVAALTVLVAAYCSWPLFGLKQIGSAVQNKDGASLSMHLDRVALRRSLIDQIGRAYLKVTGKDQGLNSFQIAVALQVAASLVGPRVDQMLQPDSLMDLLRQGGTEKYGQLPRIKMPKLVGPNVQNLFRIVRNTEYSGRDFYIVLPLTADEQTGYRIRLTLEDWTWKLSGIGLPAQIRTRIAREIVRKGAV